MAKITVKVKVDDRGLLKVNKTFGRFKGGKAGFFDGNSYDNGLTVAENASIHNFGTKTIPARPFMDEASKEFESSQAKVGKIYRSAIETGRPEIANVRIGAFYTQLIRKAIRDGNFKALKPATIKRKKSSKPLIDTGLLIGSVEWKDN